MSDLQFMSQALALAKCAQAQGEVPVGCVLVHENKIIAEGYNQSIMQSDPTAHAEIVALRAAAKYVSNYRLPNTTLYVTLEPCPMCAGALVHARVACVKYACSDPSSGAQSCFQMLNHEKLNHRMQFEKGLLASESSTLLKNFFKEKRI